MEFDGNADWFSPGLGLILGQLRILNLSLMYGPFIVVKLLLSAERYVSLVGRSFFWCASFTFICLWTSNGLAKVLYSLANETTQFTCNTLYMLQKTRKQLDCCVLESDVFFCSLLCKVSGIKNKIKNVITQGFRFKRKRKNFIVLCTRSLAIHDKSQSITLG